MSRAEHLLRAKSPGALQRIAISVSPRTTVLEAAREMNRHHIGSVVVIDDCRLVGIFTERDVLRRVVSEQRDPATTPVAEVMTTPVACATPRTLLDEMRQVMRDRRIRHLPVIDETDRVIGMISIGDLNRADHEQQEQTIRYLEEYMYVP